MIREEQGRAEQPYAVLFRDVSVTSRDVAILDEVSAFVPLGSSTMIVGPNGAGKTSLLLALLGEIPHGGAITLGRGKDGQPPRMGYVPQRIDVDRGMPLTVMEFLAMGLQRRPLWLGIQKASGQKAAALLYRVQAEHLSKRRLGALSGGELQRVLLALALAREPDLLILDEPSAGVDVQGDLIFCELLEELRAEQGFTQIMVSHDLGMVAHHATHVICLKRRVVAQGAPAQVFTDVVLTRLFGMHQGVLSLPKVIGVPEGGEEHA